jgi:hypothetical protein
MQDWLECCRAENLDAMYCRFNFFYLNNYGQMVCTMHGVGARHRHMYKQHQVEVVVEMFFTITFLF